MILNPTQQTQIDRELRTHLGPKRYEHVYSVKDLAEQLARIYGEDTERVKVAALLHDYVKWMSPDELVQTANRCGMQLGPPELRYPKILHALVGSEVARYRFGIQDPDILDAIRQHTTGDEKMGLLAKILYVADYAEPHRTHETAPVIRQKAITGALDEACLMALGGTILHLIRKRALIHPQTIAAYNDILSQINEQRGYFGTHIT